jgi:hypothetical protein
VTASDLRDGGGSGISWVFHAPPPSFFERSPIVDAQQRRGRVANASVVGFVKIAEQRRERPVFAMPASRTASCSTRTGLIALRRSSSGLHVAASFSAVDQSFARIAPEHLRRDSRRDADDAEVNPLSRSRARAMAAARRCR